ncbi:MAG: putative nitrogen fixation protein NifT [Leptolyngbyaceae cyanobacterium bins.59]|nr:putative nitrogen fixation protein NifT [Leptolyngbyaceae cyanobacterium bins.59]
MKVMFRLSDAGKLLAYVAKKDLEEEVVSQADSGDNKVFTLANGWELEVPGLFDSLRLPQTIEARRLS